MGVVHRPFKRIFVANRGEIAVRIVRACQAMGIESVVGVSEADRGSMAARMADRAVCIGPAPASASYLRPQTLIAAALGTGCQAIHPGYGFLSERAMFQRLCAEVGLVFIGPSADAIERMGDKVKAIATARSVGVPVVPGRESITDVDQLLAAAGDIGYPCLLKAAAGGGGRGMRVLRREHDAAAAFASAQGEAQSAFGDATLYLEKYIEDARHIEIQVIADHHGHACHLHERDCSVQRRHQKLVEETPSPALSPELRARMTQAALDLTRAVDYTNAGTVEFVYDSRERRFYFLEMNTRIQVEHPVTEMVTGVDLVQEQIRIAMGLPLSFTQDQVTVHGHAIECRINAEDAWAGFRPSPGVITGWEAPVHEGVRLDSHAHAGYSVPPFYDSMIAKVIAHGSTRQAAIERLARYLSDLRIHGIATTVPFQLRVIGHPRFQAGDVTTTWVERELIAELGTNPMISMETT